MREKLKAAVVGAGLTGRGFIGRLLYENNIEFTLIDKNKDLISSLWGGYTVSYFSDRAPVHIRPEASVHVDDQKAHEALKNADLIFVSVTKQQLSEAAAYIDTIQLKNDCILFVCENMQSALLSFEQSAPTCSCEKSEGIIFCTTIQTETMTDIISEEYDSIPFHASVLSEKSIHMLSQVLPNLKPEFAFGQLIKRKLFTYNAATAVLSFLGLKKGYSYLYEAAVDAQIREKLNCYLNSIAEAITSEFSVTPEEQKKFGEMAIEKFANQSIKDPISRNIRNPLGKLTPDERLIGPLKLLEAHHMSDPVLVETIALAIEYSLKENTNLTEQSIIEQVCQIPIDSATGRTLCAAVRKEQHMHTYIEDLKKLFSSRSIIDLAPVIENGMPRWPTHPQIIIEPSITHKHDGYFCQTLVMGEHSGAHVDAPAHIIPAMSDKTIDTYKPEVIIGPAVVYHLESLGLEPGMRITREQIEKLEQSMPSTAGEGDIVLLHFGWMKYWFTDNRWKYYAMNAPGLAEDAVELFAQRKVKAVGSDTAACDTPVKEGEEYYSYGHKNHWLPNEILIIEMLANLERIENRCFFVALPLKIAGGSGSPIRPIALV